MTLTVIIIVMLLFHFQLEEEVFADALNCTSPLEMRYHRDILRIRLAPGLVFNLCLGISSSALCVYTCACVCVCMHTCVYAYVCVCVCMHACICVCMHMLYVSFGTTLLFVNTSKTVYCHDQYGNNGVTQD